MKRLIEDASKMTDVQKELGVTVKEGDMSFANIAQAISVVQKNMGIMGTTASEASGTIEGATGSMQSAWQNMVTGLADENADFSKLAENFINTLVTPDGKGGVIGTMIPRITQVIKGVSGAINTLLPQLINIIVPIIQENLPLILNAVSEALTTIVGVIPQIMPAISAIIPEIINTLVSLLPQIIDAGIKVIISLIQGITDAIPTLMDMIPDVIEAIINVVTDNLGLIIDTGLNLLLALTDGIINAIPKLVKKIPKIITNIVKTLLDNIPKIIDAGVKLLTSLANNLPLIIETICEALPKIITGITTALTDPETLGALAKAGVTLFVALIKEMPKIILTLVTGVGKIIDSILEGISDAKKQMAKVGLDLIKGLWEGINDATDWLLEKIKGFGKEVLKGIKDFFGIKSPSKVMENQVGKFLAEGIGVGFEDEMKNVTKEMQDSIPTSFDLNASINSHGTRRTGYNEFSYDSMVSAFKQALSEVKIELDNEVAGAFVDKTVTKMVYARR